MKKIIDKKIVYANAAILIVGIIAGIIFLILTSKIDKLIIKTEITDFFELLSNNKSASLENLINSFKYNMTYIIIITISSIIYVLSPLILFMNFYKGMLIGFLISSIIMNYKIKGILYSILIIFPHHILMCLTIIIYSSIMIHFSYKLIKGTYKNENINLKIFIKKIGIIFLSGTILSLTASLLEIYISPLLIKLFI